MTSDIVITGMGAVTPIGDSVESFWHSNLAGRSGLRLERDMDLSDLPCGWVIGVISDDVKRSIRERWGGRSMGDALMRAAVEQALDDARFKQPPARNAGLIWLNSCPASGSSPAEYETYIKQQAEQYLAAGDNAAAMIEHIRASWATPAAAESANLPTEISRRLGVPVLASRVEATCAGGVRAIVEAARLLRSGKVDFAVVAGAVIRRSHYVLSQYGQLMALSRWKDPPTQASMPFDKRRSGMVISEAAGALVLETVEHAKARGVEEAHAVLGGWGLAVDTAHVTAPRIEMIERVMRTALARSKAPIEEVDAINTHGTSTRLNDISEARALHQVFGKRMAELNVCAVKSLTGHCSGASGILEAITAALTLCRGVIPPVVTCTQPDPECNVKTNLVPVERPIRTVLKNSFGFGGQYASMIFRRPPNPRLGPAGTARVH